MKYIIPAKTFLIGEYSVLVGGSALGLATGPGFQVHYSEQEKVQDHVQDNDQDNVHYNDVEKSLAAFRPTEFHPQSPAGYLLNIKKKQLGKLDSFSRVKPNFEIQLTNLFSHQGGFGRSTAEYLSILILDLVKKPTEFSLLRKEYQQISQKTGAMASGFDLAIQYFGQVTFFSAPKNQYLALRWFFATHDFILVSTGNKVKTHEHLQEISLDQIKDFPKTSNAIIESCLLGNVDDFIYGLNAWTDFLCQHGLVTDFSLQLKQKLEESPDVLCAKPCGALGADVILVFCEKEKSLAVQKEINELQLTIQATSKDLILGVRDQLSFNQYQVGDHYVD